MNKIFYTLILFIFSSLNAYAGIFSKDIFKFERCFTESYSNHNDWIKNSGFVKWEWEINLKKKSATRIAQLASDNMLRVDSFNIIAVTDEFIKTDDPTGTSYIFFRKNGEIQVKGLGLSKMFCEKYS